MAAKQTHVLPSLYGQRATMAAYYTPLLQFIDAQCATMTAHHTPLLPFLHGQKATMGSILIWSIYVFGILTWAKSNNEIYLQTFVAILAWAKSNNDRSSGSFVAILIWAKSNNDRSSGSFVAILIWAKSNNDIQPDPSVAFLYMPIYQSIILHKQKWQLKKLCSSSSSSSSRSSMFFCCNISLQSWCSTETSVPFSLSLWEMYRTLGHDTEWRCSIVINIKVFLQECRPWSTPTVPRVQWPQAWTLFRARAFMKYLYSLTGPQ